jgi:hypothetical protein
MEYRELTNDEVIEWVNPVCIQRGWAELNTNPSQRTCYVIGAFDGIELVGFFAMQLHPFLGPLWTSPDHRSGEVSRRLAEDMDKFMAACQARGVITIADSPVSARLCERYGMVKIESPVYMKTGL